MLQQSPPDLRRKGQIFHSSGVVEKLCTISEIVIMITTDLIFGVSLIVIIGASSAIPENHKTRRPVPVFKDPTGGLELPINSSIIRENIVNTFSCQERIYGYYADIENECQIFHICLPQSRGARRFSFICPQETVFNQATFVCTQTESSIPCEESEKYYDLNAEIGKEEIDENSTDPSNNELETTPGTQRSTTRRTTPKKSRRP